MPDRILNNEFIAFITKIIIPALITTAIAIAIDVKNNITKVSWITVLMSIIIGLGGSYIFGDMIMENVQSKAVPVAVSAVTLLTEKTFKFFIHRFKVDELIVSIIDLLLGTSLKDKTRSK